MASHNRAELASILNESAFRWSFGSTGEYAKLLESFLKENNLPVPKFPKEFTSSCNIIAQPTSSNLCDTSMSGHFTTYRNNKEEFPSHSDMCYTSTTTPLISKGNRTTQSVQLPSSDTFEQLPIREMSIKDLVFLLLWDLIKEYKESCSGIIPEEVQRFLQVQRMFHSIDDSAVGSAS